MSSEETQLRPDALASLIDHTLLKPEATQHDIARLCHEARLSRFASVCVNPYWVRFVKSELAGSPVRICTVIAFPLGANDPQLKLAEAETALAVGAQEIDAVQNIGALRSGALDLLDAEFRALAGLAHRQHALLKIILETCLLTEDEKVTSCRLAQAAGADFVKTSTGFSTSGATVADVALMRRTVGGMGVKASGGIRTLASLRSMLAAGATRIGTSSGPAILAELQSTEFALATPVPEARSY